MNLLEKIGIITVGSFVNGIEKVNDCIKAKTGCDLIEKMGEQAEKEEKERQEHWGRWALKKLAKRTMFGIFGGYMSSK